MRPLSFMKISQVITDSNYGKYVEQFSLFFKDLTKKQINSDAALNSFSLFMESTFPKNISNLDYLESYFRGNKASIFLRWYMPLVDVWKEYQRLSLPYSQNLLDPEKSAKIDQLFEKLLSVKIDHSR